MKLRVLFLCTELASYLNACIIYLKANSGAEIRVYHWPKATSAPLQNELPGIKLHEKSPNSKQDILTACITFNPAIIYTGGWVDKEYLKVARHFKKLGIPVVCGLDNAWKGTFRQKISTLFSKTLVKPYFTHLWVAGSRQFQFARQLGYSPNDILHDLYTADIERFSAGEKRLYDKYLLFVGRFEKEKGVDYLYEVFNHLSDRERNGWKLRLIGNGRLRDSIIGNEHILVEDFMQPEILISSSKNVGGFILPSIEEPWGVVVQEFAAAQLPLLLSDKVNAGEKYLIHHYNGYRFKSNDRIDLKKALIRFFQLPPDELQKMGSRSKGLAFTNNHELWTSRFLSVLQNQNRE